MIHHAQKPQSPQGPNRFEPRWLHALVAAEPRAPLVIPFMAYLLLMLLQDAFPPAGLPIAIALHILLVTLVILAFRRYFPPLGETHLLLAIVAGLAATLLWVKGQHLADHLVIAGRSLGDVLGFQFAPPFLKLSAPQAADPRADLQNPALFAAYVTLRSVRAVLIVPIIEELFWRGYLLRAFVNWHRYESVPWGRFAWSAFLGTALLSTVQHPANWLVSIACWMFYNALFFWKKSLALIMITHGVTNLALYAYVLYARDWRFW